MATQAPKRDELEEDDIIVEVAPKVTNISPCFVGLPQEEIVKIFHNRFKAINLYRLRHMRGLRYKAFQDQERTGIKDGMIRLRKPYRTFKDFGTSFYKVWGMHSSTIPSNIVAGVRKDNVPFSHMRGNSQLLSVRFGGGNITYSALIKIIHIENSDIKYMR